MKKYFVILTVTAILLSLLSGCSGNPISASEAQNIALKDLGVSAADAQDVHTHVLTEGGKPGYSIHITVGDSEYEYVISADGEILSSTLVS